MLEFHDISLSFLSLIPTSTAVPDLLFNYFAAHTLCKQLRPFLTPIHTYIYIFFHLTSPHLTSHISCSPFPYSIRNMIIPSRFHRILLLLLLSPVIISLVEAQPPPPGNESDYPYAKFSPSMAIIIVVLIAALFFMGFFSVYIRHCTDSSGSIRRALSMGGRRGAAPRGLDAAVLETFPTFTYAEVKDHKVGQNALECAVCLNEFEDSETLRLIPKCDHVFHPECVDVWLQSHVTCPVCRANLVPQTADDDPVLDSEPTAAADDVAVERSYSRTGEIAVQIDENRQQQQVGGDDTNRASSFDFPTRPPRSWSVRTAKVFGLGKFRSHSTGHSLVQPGENLDRFTLRLPDVVRKEMMERAVLTRTGSYAPTLARERSSRRGYRTGGGEGTGWAGRFYSKMDKSEPEAKSDRWAIFNRGLSMRSTKVTAETGESSGSSGPPMKLPSFKCLEPKTADETGLMLEDRNKSPV